MNKRKKDTIRNELKIKVPTEDKSHSVTVKWGLPYLMKPAFPTRFPQHLPRLSNILLQSGVASQRTRKHLLVETEKVRQIDMLPSCDKSRRNQELCPILRQYQPSWFKVVSMKYEQKERRRVAKILPKLCEQQHYCECKTDGNKKNKPSQALKSKSDNRRVKRHIGGTKHSKRMQPEDNAIEKKIEECYLETETCKRTLERQITIPTKVRIVTSNVSNPTNPIREKCWIPNEDRRRLLGPKEHGGNE